MLIRRAAFAAVAVACAWTGPARAALLADGASAVGDSITRAFDANTDFCTYTDQPARSFASGDDHDAQFCSAGGNDTFSHAERLECAKGDDIAIFNDAESGRLMAMGPILRRSSVPNFARRRRPIRDGRLGRTWHGTGFHWFRCALLSPWRDMPWPWLSALPHS